MFISIKFTVEILHFECSNSKMRIVQKLLDGKEIF